MAGKPSVAIQRFFERHLFGKAELVLTMKSSEGASINLDGPFQFVVYPWGETVIQPEWAPRRGEAVESQVHMHVPWDTSDLWICLWYFGAGQYIPHDLRICFFNGNPGTERREPMFWFYAYQKDKICELLPARHRFTGEAVGTPARVSDAAQLEALAQGAP